MTNRRSLLLSGLAAAAALPFLRFTAQPALAAGATTFEYSLTDAQWRAKLPGLSYDVLRHEATERPFTSPLNDEHRAGTFACKGCALPLFASSTKFESGTGWPSFYAPLQECRRTRQPTTASSWSGPKSIAVAVAGILAMCSTMAPNPPACAIA